MEYWGSCEIYQYESPSTPVFRFADGRTELGILSVSKFVATDLANTEPLGRLVSDERHNFLAMPPDGVVGRAAVLPSLRVPAEQWTSKCSPIHRGNADFLIGAPTIKWSASSGRWCPHDKMVSK